MSAHQQFRLCCVVSTATMWTQFNQLRSSGLQKTYVRALLPLVLISTFQLQKFRDWFAFLRDPASVDFNVLLNNIKYFAFKKDRNSRKFIPLTAWVERVHISPQVLSRMLDQIDHWNWYNPNYPGCHTNRDDLVRVRALMRVLFSQSAV